MATAAPPCITFAGFEHCPVGGATIQLAGDRLQVNNPGQAIGAGVSIDLPDVTSWTGGLAPQFAAGSTPIIQSSSLADGVVTSRSEIRKVGNRAVFKASFTGSATKRKYTAQLLDDGVLVGFVPNIPSDEPGGSASSTILVQMMLEGFVVAPAGNCEWEYQYASNQTFTLPDGRVLAGDTLRFVEQVDPSGGYPYTTFDGLVFQGNATRLDLKNESIEE